MSLPTTLKVYSKENDLLAKGFINVGRFVDAKPLVIQIRTCLLKIDKSKTPNPYFTQFSPSWKEQMYFVEVYGIRIPKELIKKICSHMTLEKFDACVKEMTLLLQ